MAAEGTNFFRAESQEQSPRVEDYVNPTEEQLDTWESACVLAKPEIPTDDGKKHNELKARLLEFWMLLIW